MDEHRGERPIAATIFGILNIGFGAFAVFGATFSRSADSLKSLPSNPYTSQIVNLMSELDANTTYTLWRNISVPCEIVASLALIAAGIGLLKMQNWARLTSIGIAIYRIIAIIVSMVVLSVTLLPMLSNAFKNVPGWVIGAIVCAGVVGMILSMIYPVLLLIFLTRRKLVEAFGPVVPAPPAL